MIQTEKEKREGAQRDQSDFPIHREHDGEHPDDRQDMGGELQKILSKEVLQGVGVTGDSGQQVARPGLVVE